MDRHFPFLTVPYLFGSAFSQADTVIQNLIHIFLRGSWRLVVALLLDCPLLLMALLQPVLLMAEGLHLGYCPVNKLYPSFSSGLVSDIIAQHFKLQLGALTLRATLTGAPTNQQDN